MAVMKYTPQFVERQYVPTNNIGLIDQVLTQRQKEFDTAKMLENQAISELYGLQTTQGFEPKRNELIQGLESQIDEAVKKRGGDYGAAIKDIMGVVSKAQSDPFFQRNRRAMEQSKLLDQMTAKNPNLYVGNDVRKLGYRDDLTDEDLNFNVLDPEEVRKLAKERLSHFDNKKLTGIYTSPSGYDVAKYTRGPSEDDIQKLMQDDEFVNSMRGNFPQLADSDDPKLQELFRRETEAAARSYRRDPEETVLGFNPYVRQAMDRQQENLYGAVIPTAAVGTKGVQNTYPIRNPKDFFNLPNDGSRMGLLRRSITQDIISDESFNKGNRRFLSEFGNIDNARSIVDNYTSGNSVLESNVIKNYLDENPDYLKGAGTNERYVRLSNLVQKLEMEGKLDRNAPQKNKEEYQRAKTLVDNFETKLNERLFQENSDLEGKFKHFDIFEGDDKTRTSTKTKMKDFQDYVSTNFHPINFNFEASNNKDINFSDQIKLQKKDDKNYKLATEGKFTVTGIAIDPILGVKLQLETQNKDGGKTTHIVSPANGDIEQALVKAYTAGSHQSDIFQDYKMYSFGKTGESILENLNKLPHLSPPTGVKTVGEYKRYLVNLWRDNPNNPDIKYQGQSIITYFDTMGINDNTQL